MYVQPVGLESLAIGAEEAGGRAIAATKLHHLFCWLCFSPTLGLRLRRPRLCHRLAQRLLTAQ